RLLWEIGPDGAEVRCLRARLGLASGYASRLLRALEEDGLVAVTAGADDARVRRVALTARGRREWSELESRSEELAASVLAPLSERQRDQLVDAMATVERLLTASMITTELVSPQSADARYCINEYFPDLHTPFHTRL